jgi:DNA polymerase phi
MSSLGKDSAYLKFFWDLAVDDKETRVQACHDLMKYLASICESKPEEKDTIGLMEYTMKRLVRGLASPRDSARQGFAACLCDFFRLPHTSTASALSILDDNTKVGSIL